MLRTRMLPLCPNSLKKLQGACDVLFIGYKMTLVFNQSLHKRSRNSQSRLLMCPFKGLLNCLHLQKTRVILIEMKLHFYYALAE